MNDLKLNSDLRKEEIIGKIFTVTIDRPIGSEHPKRINIKYPINYGYIEGIIAPDCEEQDVYILGIDYPLKQFTGKIIAIIHRLNDVEDKWVMAANDKKYSEAEIKRLTYFQEQFYKSIIILW